MKLLTAELREQIPPLYSQEQLQLQERMVHAKFFFPARNWTWFVTEGQESNGDFMMFGFVIGFVEEWGYFSLNELEAIEVDRLTVERDLYFQPDIFKKVMAREYGS